MSHDGTQGYAQEAPELLRRYEAIPFAERHRPALHLLPEAPCSVLDIGAGSGADAAHLAGLGHRVLAVEPVAELREPATALHASPRIEWLDDSLPALARTRARGRCFDLVLLAAVWMHLDADERAAAMPNVAALLAPAGCLILTMRHGPVPAGRRMFEVAPQETVAQAAACGLRLVVCAEAPSAGEANRRAGVTWTHLVFSRERVREPAPGGA